MKVEIAKSLLERTQTEYKKIAFEFARTRSYPWKELKEFESYVKDGDKILDLGCGNGRLYEIFKDMSINYVGVDSNEEIIKIARRKWGNDNKFLVADALNLPFPDQEFDVVFCIATLQHIPSRELQFQFLENAKRILKKDGLFIMTNWNLWQLTLKRKSVWKYNLEKWKTSDAQWQSISGTTKDNFGFKDLLTKWQGNSKIAYLYYHAFTLRELNSLVKKAGLKSVENFYVSKGKKSHWWNGWNIATVAEKL